MEILYNNIGPFVICVGGAAGGLRFSHVACRTWSINGHQLVDIIAFMFWLHSRIVDSSRDCGHSVDCFEA